MVILEFSQNVKQLFWIFVRGIFVFLGVGVCITQELKCISLVFITTTALPLYAGRIMTFLSFLRLYRASLSSLVTLDFGSLLLFNR